MCPGLTSKGAFLDMETEKGAGVQVDNEICRMTVIGLIIEAILQVHCEGKELAIAVGTMAMTPKEIKDVNKGDLSSKKTRTDPDSLGVGIAVNHCLNDGLWHWKHVKQIEALLLFSNFRTSANQSSGI